MTTSSSATTATATTKGRNQKSVSKFSKGHNGKSKKYEENFSDDEIDAFHAEREKILLGDNEDSQSDFEGEEFDEAVMDLPSSDTSEEEQGEEEEEEEEEEQEGWGRYKKTFYSADVALEDLKDEAREARKLQKKQLSSLREQDFGIVKKTGTKSGLVKVNFSDSDSEDDDKRGKEEEEEEDDKYASESELVNMNGESLEGLLPEQEKLELITKHAPETKKFLEEFRLKAKEIKEYLEPVLGKMATSNTEKGLGFLESKYQLLIGYCANLAYYLLLKVKGKSIEKHPVIERLVRYRLLIERIKPMEAKLQYQVDKLLHATSNDNLSKKGKNNNVGEVGLAFRPNIDIMEASEASDSDANDGIYKAPKVAPVQFQDNKSRKANSLEDRERELASKSRLLADLQAELEDRPDEDALDPVYGRSTINTLNKHLDNYEEENFIRVTLSKKEQKKLESKQSKPIDELEDLNDFFRESEKNSKSGKSEVDRLLGTKSLKKKYPSGGDNGDGDDGIVTGSKRSKLLATKNSTLVEGQDDEELDSEMSEIEDDLDDDREDDFYKAVKSQVDNKRNPKSFNRGGDQPVKYHRPLKNIKPGDPRPATYSMIKNKGLTPSRPKEVRNPRVRQRVKWESAQKKIKSLKPIAKTQSGPYMGESTGIRTRISRSVKF